MECMFSSLTQAPYIITLQISKAWLALRGGEEKIKDDP